MSLERKFSLEEGGGFYFDGAKIAPDDGPYLFVGLGGTGVDALLKIKNEVKTKMVLPKDENGNVIADTPESIAFLAIDDDKECFKKKYGSATLDFDKECLWLSQEDLGDTLFNMIQSGHVSEEWTWFDRDIRIKDSFYYYYPMRQLGRARLFYNIDTVISRISKAINDVYKTYQGDLPIDLKVFLITGLAGTTGSGIFLDVAYIIRELASSIGYAQIFGYFFTPDLAKADYPQLYCNGFAALKELDYWMSNREHGQHFVQRYSPTFGIDSEMAPFDYCHLITAKNAKGKPISYSEAIDTVCDAIWGLICYKRNAYHMFDTVWNRVYLNLDGIRRSKDHIANYRYLSLGVSKVEIPYKEITSLLAARVFEKLDPIFLKEPDKESFDADCFELGLNYSQLESFIQREVPVNPTIINRYRYGDIWPTNTAKERVEAWLVQAAQRIRENSRDFVNVHEAKFRDYINRILKDTSFGPCYVEKLIFSNTSECLVKTLEGVMQDCAERLAYCAQKELRLANELQQSYVAGQRAGLFNRGKATEEYLEALGRWANVRYCYWMYNDLFNALNKFIKRLSKYHIRIFKNLGDILKTLSKVSHSNIEYLNKLEIELQNNPEKAVQYIVTPMEFEKMHAHAIEIIKSDAKHDFLYYVADNLLKFVGTDMDGIDDDNICEPDIANAVSRIVSECFSSVLNTDVESIIAQKMQAGENAESRISDILLALEESNAPAVYMPDYYNSLELELSLVSVPDNCDRVLACAKNRAYSRNCACFSTDLTKIQKIKLLSNLPLYSFSEIFEMEDKYECAMREMSTRRGIHLHWEWREELPSPLPETTWNPLQKESVTKRFSKAINDMNRNFFNECFEEGIIRIGGEDEPCAFIYLADEEKLNSLELVGPLEEQRSRIERIRNELWNDNAATIKIFPFDRRKKSVESIIENNIRFPHVIKAIKKQLNILHRLKSLMTSTYSVELYVDALFANLIYEEDSWIKLRRGESDNVPFKLFDKNTGADFADYEAYKALCKILYVVCEDIKSQRERVRYALVNSDGSIDQVITAEIAKRLNKELEEIAVAMNTLTEQMERTSEEQKKVLTEIFEFYTSFEQILKLRLAVLGF